MYRASVRGPALNLFGTWAKKIKMENKIIIDSGTCKWTRVSSRMVPVGLYKKTILFLLRRYDRREISEERKEKSEERKGVRVSAIEWGRRRWS